MAHADYECCAVCDCKGEYNTKAYAKQYICESCRQHIKDCGLRFRSPAGLIKWLRKSTTTVGQFREALPNYSECCYDNEVDRAVDRFFEKRGMPVPGHEEN